MSSYLCFEMPLSWEESCGIIGSPRVPLLGGGVGVAGGVFWLALKVLPMGFSWSCYFVQEFHEQVLKEVG